MKTTRRLGTGCVVAVGLLVAIASGAAAQGPDFHSTAPGPNHLSWRAGWDVGTGFVRIAPSPDGPPGTAPADTFRILADPRPDARPVGRAFHRGYRLFVEAREEGLVDGALEVGYEERALPVLLTAPDGRWLKVSFAFDGDDEARTGWVDSDHPSLEHRSWDAWLRERGVLLFVDPDSIGFFTAPDGERRELSLAPSAGSQNFDHVMVPIASESASENADGDPWMEVRVVSPSDYCADTEPEAKSGRDAASDVSLEERAWIRYLTDDGRPRVWTFTRGC